MVPLQDNGPDHAGPRLDLVFETFADAGFAAVCWSALQWDLGTPGSPSAFLIEGLRGTRVRLSSYFEDGNADDRFTPVKDLYVDAADLYRISSFDPHGESCELAKVCPQCN